MTVLLTRDDIERLLRIEDLLAPIEAAFVSYATGQAVSPQRAALHPAGGHGVLLTMPSAVANPPAVGTKLVAVYPDNPSRGLPRLISIYLLTSYEDGIAQ